MKTVLQQHVALTAALSITLGCILFAGYLFLIPAPAPDAAKNFPVPLSLDPGAITARSAVVYDPATHKILFAKDASTPRPLASLTKLMSATVVLNSAPSLTQPVTLTKNEMAAEGDAGDWGFKEGDTATLGDLLKFGLVASSNDAMAAAAASLGGEYLNDMNHAAASLGLTNTYFLNSTGLDESDDTAGAYGSATDVAKLAANFLKTYPQFFELTANPVISIEASGRTLVANATAAPLLSIPGFIGAKTGYTDLAGGNLVAAVDLTIGHPVIAVVLGSTEEGRFSDIETLINVAREQNL